MRALKQLARLVRSLPYTNPSPSSSSKLSLRRGALVKGMWRSCDTLRMDLSQAQDIEVLYASAVDDKIEVKSC